MKEFFAILAFLIPVSAIATENPVASCLSDLQAQRQQYQGIFSKFALQFDRELSRLMDIGRDQEESLKAILGTMNAEENFPFLVANAAESCRNYQVVFEQRMRKFLTFFISLLVTIGASLLYLMIYGLPKFRKPVDIALLLLCLATPSYAADGKLTVYTYDSLASKKSLGGRLAEEFQKQTGTAVELVGFKSAGEALNQIVLEGKTTNADVLIGVDNTFLEKAKKSELFEKLNLSLAGFSIPKKLLFDADLQFLPFDYGYLAFVYDGSRTKGLEGITSLEILASHAALKKKIVIEDPRTSSIGQCFLAWTKAAFSPAAYESFWKTFLSQLVTVAPGWSAAYGLFLKKEADLVLSYTTSPAYHEEEEKNANFQFLPFKEGHYQQVEGVGVLKSSKKTALARKFVSLLLSRKIQEEIPKLQWMYPVDPKAKLPKSFERLSRPSAISTSAVDWDKNREAWLREWTLLLSKGK